MRFGTRRRLVMDGHPVVIEFVFFDESEMTAKEYGWMVKVDDERRMGVFDRYEEAVEHAEELVTDVAA